ncbi:hypothetical protein [Facklamia sp. P12955]|uniref:hypothetical protein n=1 Tax=unclassified Facklamia TaxID=2622293 RepID=UPI003D184023
MLQNNDYKLTDFDYKGLPIDTEYKRIIDKRNDYHQIINSLHLIDASRTGFLQPNDKELAEAYCNSV